MECEAEHADAWNQYLSRSPNGSFYHLFGWKSVNEESFGHKTYYLAAMDADLIVGVLPLVLIESRIFGRILASMPFVNFGGPCTESDSVLKQLLSHAYAISVDCHADYLELRGKRPFDDRLLTATHKVSMSITLKQNPDDLWNAFKSKHRTNIRRVYKDAVRVNSGKINLLTDFYTLFCQAWRAHGTPVYRKEYFRKILDTFPDQTRIFVAYQGNIPIAAAFNGYYSTTVEGMWAATHPSFRHLQPNYVLYWEMIKHACEEGFHTYHLGRSTTDTGGASFKKKWNANETQLYWQYFLERRDRVPQLNVDNPRYRLAIEAWKRLPMSIIQFIGPILAKNIP